ncbi:MAG: transposase [Chloroflexota bacterium]
MTKNGCVWRALPSDFPAWQTVYYHFRIFRHPDGDIKNCSARGSI